MSSTNRAFKAQLADYSFMDLTVRKPTKQERDAADMEFAAVYNRSLLGGCPTRVKMIRRLRENGLIDAQDEARQIEIRDKVSDIDGILKRKDLSEDDRAKHQTERDKLMLEFNNIRNDVDAMFSQTADAKAEDAQRNFLIACVTEKADGERLYPSVEALHDHEDGDLYQRVAYEFITLQQGRESDAEQFFPTRVKPVEKKEEKEEEKKEDQNSGTSQADQPPAPTDAPPADAPPAEGDPSDAMRM